MSRFRLCQFTIACLRDRIQGMLEIEISILGSLLLEAQLSLSGLTLLQRVVLCEGQTCYHKIQQSAVNEYLF